MSNRQRAAFEAEVLAQLAAISRQLDAIDGRLQPARGPRDVDGRLLLALDDAIGRRPFTGKDVYAFVDIHDAAILRDALSAADCDGPRTFGWWCRRMAGIAIEGLRLERRDETRDGAQWQLCELREFVCHKPATPQS